MKPLKTQISITLDSDLVENIRLLAEYDDRPLSSYINKVLKEYLQQPSVKKILQETNPQ